MNQEEVLNILKAFAICNLQSGDFTCLDCPFKGDLVVEGNRHYLECTAEGKLTDERVIEAVKTLNV